MENIKFLNNLEISFSKNILNHLPTNSLGIYIHFPFCYKICFYCDFFKIKPYKTNLYLNNLINELLSSKNYLDNINYNLKEVNTIYFGGGTPNLLNPKNIDIILKIINKNFKISKNNEITIELNPELITKNYIKTLKEIGINRVSIGVQTFSLFGLRILGRTTDPNSIVSLIELTAKYFDNVSIDLIYLYPFQKIDSLIKDLEILKNLPINHISYYALDIYDDKKVIYHKFNTIIEEINKIQENFQVFYNIIHQYLEDLGFEHYEVSNFAKNKKYCLHNLRYWYYLDYLGFGPSAVSKLNINNKTIRITKKHINYFKNTTKENTFKETIKNIEEIDYITSLKEKIMLSLRTKWGIQIKYNNINYNFKVHPLKFIKLNSIIHKIYNKLNLN